MSTSVSSRSSFGCGCERKKTVSLTKKYLENIEDRLGHPASPKYLGRVLDMKVRDSMERAHCSKHPDEGVIFQEEQFDTYTVAEWMRDHPGEKPAKFEPPSVAELATYERDCAEHQHDNRLDRCALLRLHR